MKNVVITGINGQLGSYLAELLLAEGNKVIGLYRRGSTDKFGNIAHLLGNSNLELVSGDITDQAFIFHVLNTYRPREIYNTAAQSFVHTSFTEPRYTFEVDTLGVLNFLEAIKQMKLQTKLITCSTSEMFGKSVSYLSKVNSVPVRINCSIGEHDEDAKLFQDEETPLFPQSPYGIAKLAAHHLIRLYRESYDIWCAGNINFNFESPRRGKEFVTRKITNYIGLVKNNKTKAPLSLGNLDAKRDWGHAKDVALAMWLSVQQDNPCDYIVSTMNTHTVREFCEKAFSYVDLDYNKYVDIDPKFFRPAEVDYLLGDSSRIRTKLNWSPSVSFDELVTEMVENDIRANKS